MVQTGVGVSVGVGVAVAVGVIVGVRVGVDVGVGVELAVGVGVGVRNVSLNAKTSSKRTKTVAFGNPIPPNMTGSVPLVFQKAGPKRAPGTTLELDSFKTPYTERASTLWLPLIHAH